MDRYIVKRDGKSYIENGELIKKTDIGYCGEAVDRLAKFEDMYELLVKNQDKISKELERLRYEGKTKSLEFKELMTRKLIESNMVVYFKINGIE
ncbi:hypothetical protein [Alkalibacter saccharofermentans]|uniref:TnpV protein n=1 Tax=Alkalibacter saccharofermentans DSM 14828 TaxID=1120975 RepID=A0A1M4U706_9FIRM|nr:hypothetical protein [Alkalibacter saccharofermentans]SHE52542.1 hypothetical protein SAMN02746064_00666 [Alkalibacter saccharofermentans DSM 14828]